MTEENNTYQEADSLLERTVQTQQPGRQKRMVGLLVTILCAAIALFWYLNKSGKQQNSLEPFVQGENSPDAVILKFHLVSTVKGEKHWEMNSDKAMLYQNQKQAYADQIFAQYFKKNKIVSTLTADKAVINTETNATLAEGHVELVVDNGSKLETAKLNWNPDNDEIQTDGRVHVYKGADEISAVGLVADTQLNNIRFKSDVRTKMRDTHEVENFNESKKF